MDSLTESRMMVDWAEKLNDVKKEVFFKPIQEGKWSPAEILRFERIGGGMVHFDPFPDFESFNAKAAAYARNAADKSRLIREFIETRHRVIQDYESVPEEKRKQSFWIGSHRFTIESYIEDFSEHDRHHRKQIDQAADIEM